MGKHSRIEGTAGCELGPKKLEDKVLYSGGGAQEEKGCALALHFLTCRQRGASLHWNTEKDIPSEVITLLERLVYLGRIAITISGILPQAHVRSLCC
jgi:hypothetical protein